MGTSKDDLIDKIYELKKELRAAKKNTYIYQTNTLHCNDGEMHIGFGDNKWLVWNTDSLYKDLPFIITKVVKENKKMQKMYLDMIKESINEL
tara:strand:- start:258 stop:533 length:276 start_codon:yes stop_codon:yes gene_type:complete